MFEIDWLGIKREVFLFLNYFNYLTNIIMYLFNQSAICLLIFFAFDQLWGHRQLFKTLSERTYCIFKEWKGVFFMWHYSEDRVIEYYKQLKGVSRGQAIVQ